MNCYGYTFSTILEDNEKKSSFNGFSNGDTVILTYSSKYGKFRIMNLTQKGECTIKAPNHFNRSLHFSVGFGSGGEVEFEGIRAEK